jgi:hypothetical protein
VGDNALDIVVPLFTSSVSITVCGAFTYMCVDELNDPIDLIFTFTSSTANNINVITSVLSKVGVYTLVISG